jgi:hypothetical protein
MNWLGKGLFAGLADAAAKVLGIHEFPSERAKDAFSTAVHWSYGTGWGSIRGLLVQWACLLSRPRAPTSPLCGGASR